MAVIHEHFILHNHVKLPKLGLGTYKLEDKEEAYDAVSEALKAGVRHVDSSLLYRNEKSVGQAIRESRIPRHEMFITSKLPPHIKNADGAKRMFQRSLKNLGTGYLDAYIINAPGPFNDLDGDYDEGNIEVYKALEELYEDKKVRSIGVSRFSIKDIQNILDNCDIIPHINQISFFIGHTQDELVKFCKEHNITIQAFSPLGKGYVLDNPTIVKMAQKYDVEPSQIALRYNVQKGVASIPKSANKEHIVLNTLIDFEISNEDMGVLDAIDDDPREYDD